MYAKHEIEVIQFAETDIIVQCDMSDGGSEYNPWSIKPNRSDS